MSIKSQVSTAFKISNLPFLIPGVFFGGFVPLATWWLIHRELDLTRLERDYLSQPKVFLVAAGLVFSSLTVYYWARIAFKSPFKAVGFAVLLEGTMTFSSTEWLSLSALGGLLFLNAIAAAVALVEDGEKEEEEEVESQPDTLFGNVAHVPTPAQTRAHHQDHMEAHREYLQNETPVDSSRRQVHGEFKNVCRTNFEELIPNTPALDARQTVSVPAPGRRLETPIVGPDSSDGFADQRVILVDEALRTGTLDTLTDNFHARYQTDTQAPSEDLSKKSDSELESMANKFKERPKVLRRANPTNGSGT